jgi:hypothetical protein
VSKRHALSRSTHPGSAKVPKPLRQKDHRRERRVAKEAMLVDDLEAVVVPAVHRSPAAPPLAEAAEVKEPSQRRWRHWKQPFWKRRNAERHRRNELIGELAAE